MRSDAFFQSFRASPTKGRVGLGPAIAFDLVTRHFGTLKTLLTGPVDTCFFITVERQFLNLVMCSFWQSFGIRACIGNYGVLNAERGTGSSAG